MANLFSEELVKGLLKTKKKYDATEKVGFETIEDGTYDVKIDSVKIKTSKSNNNVLVKVDSITLDEGRLISSLFVLTGETQAVNLQHLRNLLIYCDEADFTEKELKDSDKFERKLQDTIGHKIRLELTTTESGFQTTSFVDSLDNEENDEEDEDDD